MENYDVYSSESTVQRLFRKFFAFNHKLTRGLANRLLDKNLVNARSFSNAILAHYAPVFRGGVINVSGWKDEDQEGRLYQEYFTSADSYVVSNAPTDAKGTGSHESEIEIDLIAPLSSSLYRRYDVVLNHTTLEHIFELDVAFKNLCDMSKDAVILVVPVLQQIHFNKGYGDYNRLTPMGIVKYFEKNGFETIVLQSNEQQFGALYCFAIAVRDSSKYTDKIKKKLSFDMGGELFGSLLQPEHLEKHVKLNWN